MRTRGDSGGFLPLTTLCRGVTRSFSRKVIYFIIVLCIMCRWIYSSYLQNYLMASPQYITSHMADDYLLAQLYRDHSIDTPVVLETSGLVSGFGFEGYTWHKNWFVELSVLYHVSVVYCTILHTWGLYLLLPTLHPHLPSCQQD